MFPRHLIIIILFLLSCGQESKRYNSIRDFPEKYHPFLKKIVNNANRYTDTTGNHIESEISREDLMKLTFSEHPLLRGYALRELLNDPTVDQQSLILDHLDDTAIICTNQGEWGFEDMKIADYMLDNAEWKTWEAKEVIIRKVFSKHNNLAMAYAIAHKVEPVEEYYLQVKEMIDRDRDYKDIERALYLLAKYKRKEDIPFIKAHLMDYSPFFTELSFQLMRAYPDTAYFTILESFSGEALKYIVCENDYESRKYIEYFRAVATYKDKRSAALLAKILQKQPIIKCDCNEEYLDAIIMNVIQNNPCPAYAGMAKALKDKTSMYLQYKYEHPPVHEFRGQPPKIPW